MTYIQLTAVLKYDDAPNIKSLAPVWTQHAFEQYFIKFNTLIYSILKS